MKTYTEIETEPGVMLRIDHYKVSTGEFIDCREYRETVPSRNGFSVPIASMPEFIKALEKATKK